MLLNGKACSNNTTRHFQLDDIPAEAQEAGNCYIFCDSITTHLRVGRQVLYYQYHLAFGMTMKKVLVPCEVLSANNALIDLERPEENLERRQSSKTAAESTEIALIRYCTSDNNCYF
jgi:hypothetical protein